MARDTRLWARFSLDFADNPKIAGLSDAAFRTLVEMVLYSRQHLTDGVLAAGVVERRWKTKLVSNLETNLETNLLSCPVQELLTNDPENPSLSRNDNGDYVVHGFLDHQESRADVEARKRRLSANGRKGGRPKKSTQNQVANQVGSQVANQVENLAENQVGKLQESRDQRSEKDTSNEVSTPYSPPRGDAIETPAEFELEMEDPTASPDFDEFWKTYPRKDSKPAARRAWDKAIAAGVPARLIIEGARRYRDDPNREPQYTATPSPWLRNERWNDPPLPARAPQGRDQTMLGWQSVTNSLATNHPQPQQRLIEGRML